MCARLFVVLAVCTAVTVVLSAGCTQGTAGGGGGGQNGGGDTFTLTLTVSPSGGSGTGPDQAGRVTAQPDKTQYDDGEAVTLTAEPETGYRFDRWEGDASGDTNPLVVTINDDTSIDAVFVGVDADTNGGDAVGGIVAGHAAAAAFGSIPANFIQAAKADFRVFYGHTSHGSQIVAGMNMLDTGAGTLSMEEDDGVDLGYEGDLGWVDITRDVLNRDGSDINLVMWSWCGGVSDNTEEGINAYLDAMNQLEADYPNVVFVYMTGHLDGGGTAGTLYVRNNQVRQYCQANDKVLYDFADVESYDPAGNYYPDEDDWCNWCEDWCVPNDCDTGDCVDDDDCQHSHCFNCYQKGRAFWWMMARLADWDGQADQPE